MSEGNPSGKACQASATHTIRHTLQAIYLCCCTQHPKSSTVNNCPHTNDFGCWLLLKLMMTMMLLLPMVLLEQSRLLM